MNCEDFRAAYLADDASVDDDYHLASCATCRALVDRLASVRTVLDDPSVWEEPPPELAARIADLPLVKAEPTLADDGDPGETGPGVPDEEHSRRRWWPMAVAVVLAFLVGMGVMVNRMNMPDWEVTMPGTELAPQASAVVRGWRTESGTRLEMTVEGLDPAPPGHHYEFWLSNTEDHISAGTFVAGGRVDMVSAVGRRNYPRLWVTIEPVDSDTDPSWVTVLDTGPLD